jgi:Ca2+-transporting ATPase
LLEAGNRIPADVRFIETHQLKVDESTLTGESNTIDRQRNYPLASIPWRLQQFRIQRHLSQNTRLMSAIAMDTELGHIAQMIQSQDSSTPLQIRLAAFGKRLSIVI